MMSSNSKVGIKLQGEHDVKKSDDTLQDEHVDTKSADDVQSMPGLELLLQAETDDPSPSPNETRSTRSNANAIKARFVETRAYLKECRDMCSNVTLLSNDEAEITKAFTTVLEVQDHIKAIVRDMVGVVLDEDIVTYRGSLEQLEQAIKEMRSQVSCRLDYIRDERRSNKSSRSSRRSNKSRSSTASSLQSNMLKLRDAQHQAAILKSSLAFNETETQLEMARKTLETKKQIAAQEAIVKECLRVERIENPFGLAEELEGAVGGQADREPDPYIESINDMFASSVTGTTTVDQVDQTKLPRTEHLLRNSEERFRTDQLDKVENRSTYDAVSSVTGARVGQNPYYMRPTGEAKRSTKVQFLKHPNVNLAGATEPRDDLIDSRLIDHSDSARNLSDGHGYRDYQEGNVTLAVVRELISAHRLPSLKLWKFNGDPMDYPKWEASFEALIESKVNDIHEKMNFLRQYLGEAPLKVVDGYFLNNTEASYMLARKELKLRYGGNTLIGNAFLTKLKSWKPVRSKFELREFSDFLLQVEANSNSVTDLRTLDFASCQMPVVSKLPQNLKNRWMDDVHRYKKQNGNSDSYPPFAAFVRFVKEQSDIKNQPEFNNLETFNADAAYKQRTVVLAANVESKECVYCGKEHHIAQCPKLKEQPIEDRKKRAAEAECISCIAQA